MRLINYYLVLDISLLEMIQAQYSIPFNIDSITIKKSSPSLSIPLHLDHHLFSSTFIAIPLFPLISSLLIYNHTQQVLFTKPVGTFTVPL